MTAAVNSASEPVWEFGWGCAAADFRRSGRSPIEGRAGRTAEIGDEPGGEKRRSPSD